MNTGYQPFHEMRRCEAMLPSGNTLDVWACFANCNFRCAIDDLKAVVAHAVENQVRA